MERKTFFFFIILWRDIKQTKNVRGWFKRHWEWKWPLKGLHGNRNHNWFHGIESNRNWNNYHWQQKSTCTGWFEKKIIVYSCYEFKYCRQNPNSKSKSNSQACSEVYRVYLIQPRGGYLVVAHRTADVRLTWDRLVTIGLVPVELSTIISDSHAAMYVVNAYIS